MTGKATPDFHVRNVDRQGLIDDFGRISPVRRVGLAVAGLVGMTLTVTSLVQPVPPHPRVTSSDNRDSAPNQLTAAQRPAVLPARGAGAAATTLADPAAAGKPDAASITLGPHAIPSIVLTAYRKAASTLAVQDPSCHLTWPVLAGIGKVETDHGRSWGAAARITGTGEVLPTILGPVLNGRNGTALVLDTDGGAYDQNRQYDRAVGPMQFVPATWAELGRDGNGDGVKDPNNIWDATLATAGYLCKGDRNLSLPADLRAAIFAYNPSTAYVRAVLAWAGAYAKAAANLPALDGVPDPLVLGAGGVAGQDPFGDAANNTYGVGDASGALNIFGVGGGLSSPVTGADTTPALHLGPSPTPSPTPKPAPSPSDSATPSLSPSGSPIPRPTQSPTPSPSPSRPPTPAPTPTPTPPTCQDPDVRADQAGAVTAVPVDTNSDGVNDVLRVTVPVTATQAGSYTLDVLLLDSHGLPVTSVEETVSLVAGSTNVAADLPGQAIAEKGAAGQDSVRVTVRDAGDGLNCAQVLFKSASVGSIDASTFGGSFTTLTG